MIKAKYNVKEPHYMEGTTPDVVTISPLFINTTIDEPLPNTNPNISFEEFMKLSEDERAAIGKDMTQEEKIT